MAPTLNAFDNGGDSRATVVTVEAAGGDLPPEGVLAFGRQEDRLAGTAYEDEVPGLTTSKTYAVAIPAEPLALDTYNQSLLKTSGTLDRTTNHGVFTPDLAVRRLTPTECERLMGWPDGWTAVGINEDGAEVIVADSSRYRMCGNGVASPVAEWIGRCIVAAEQELEA